MDIGIIESDRPFINEYNDLDKAIRSQGFNPVRIDIADISVRIDAAKVHPFRVNGILGESPIELDCAVLRHIGFVRDYEQMSQKVWSVMSMEMSGTYVANNILAWMRASDKLGALMALSSNGINVPDTRSSENSLAGYHAVRDYGKAVVKPLRMAAGLGVFKVDNPDVAMHVFSSFVNFSKPLYVQKFLEKRHNGDYRVVVVGDEVIGAEFRKSSSWKSNVAQGAAAKAARPDAELMEIAIKSAKALDLDFAGIDIAETADGYYVLEANPTVSWSMFKKVTKVDPARHIIRHIVKMAKA